jgi:hypothetical protein
MSVMKRALPKDWAPILMQAGANREAPGVLFWIVCALLVLGLNLYAPGEPTAMERLLASLMVVVTAVSIWSWMRHRNIEVAFMPVFAIAFTINFGIGIFILTSGAYQGSCPMPLLDDTYNKVLALSLAGLALTMLGYYGPWWRHITPRLPAFRLCWEDAEAVQQVACVIGALSLIAFWVSLRQNFLPGLRQPFGIASNLFSFSMIVLVILHLEHRLRVASMLFLYGVLIPVRVVLGVSHGHLSFAIAVALALLMTYATMRRRIPWILVILGFMVFCILQPVKASLRSQVWKGGSTNQEQPEADKLQALSSMVRMGMLFANTFGLKSAASAATERLSQLILFVKVAEYTPDEVPYWGGKTYYPLLFKPIPRAIYPDKPDETQSNDFGHWYAFVSPDNFTTAVNLPELVEFYGNFGPWGVLIGSLLAGILYRGMHNMLIHKQMGIGALASAIYILSSWLDFESNLSGVIGGILGLAFSVVAFHLTVLLISQSTALSRESSGTRVHAAG